MAKDHYIPAALLGRFSLDSIERMRERRIWVYRPKQRAASKEKAENIGYINKYYRLNGFEDELLVENAWNNYEDRLTTALNELSDPAVNSVDGQLWTRVLIPFVAGIFVRSPDFTRKYEGPPEKQAEMQSVLDASGVSLADNTNMSRIMAMTRSLAPIMAARWTVLHTARSEFLLTNDLGYTNGSFLNNPSKVGWTIPIGARCALQLTPCPDGHSRRIMFHGGEGVGWRTFIDHVWLKPRNYMGLNAAVSKVARDFIAGPTRESIEQHIHRMGQDSGSTFNPQMLTSHRMQIVHEFEWYRLVRALQYAPEENVDDRFALDFTCLEGDWFPPVVMFPANLPEFTTGLKLRNRIIELAMSLVPGFTDYSAEQFPWEKRTQDGNEEV